MKNPTELQNALEPVITAAVGPAAFDRLSVVLGNDHEGEPAIFITVSIRKGIRAAKKIEFTKVAEEVHRKLKSINEGRFPYVRFDFGDKAELIDDSDILPKSRNAG